MDEVKLTLNIRNPTANSDAVSSAAKRKAASIESMDEAWARIFGMKNSDADQRRLEEVKQAMEAGKVGRDSPDKRFSKAEALRMYRVLEESKIAERLAEMVEDMPDNYLLITDERELTEWVGYALNNEVEIVFDVETTGVDVYSDRIVGHVISLPKADKHLYIPTSHVDERKQLDEAFVTDTLRPLYEDEDIGKIAHNASFDIHMLAGIGVELLGLTWDTQEAMKLLNENEPTYALKPLVSKYLRIDSYGYADLFGRGTGFDEIDLDTALAYAAKDGDITLKLRDFQLHHMRQMPELLNYYQTVEVPLIPIVVEMEREGYVIDQEFAKEYGDELRAESDGLLKEVMAELGDINLNSPIQLKTALETYTGEQLENTDANRTLKPLSKKYPIVAKLLRYREITKLLGTYVDALPELIKERTGRLHANYNPNGTKTGRFSSNNPNLQNQPSQARKMFVAPEGYYIVNADFSAQEVRMIASLSREDVLLDAFAEGRDAYASLASEFFNKPYEDCYKLPDGSDTEERKRMKVVLLMSMYGASKYGLASALDISADEAQKFLDDFFKKYRKIDEFIKQSQDFANKYGYVWIGDKERKRRLPEARGDRRRYDPKRNRAMRQAPNARVQGLAALQTKKTLIRLAEVAKERGWKLWGTIHDENAVLMPDDFTEEDLRVLDEVMTQTYLLEGVDNGTDIEIQKRWSESVSADEFLRGKRPTL